MTRTTGVFLLLCFLGWGVQSVAAHPNYLTMFEQDPFRKPGVEGCNTCHIDPKGGGPRNGFGLDFAANGFTITPMLRASYADRFDIALMAPVPGGGRVYFSDPAGQFVVYEKDKQKYLVDLKAIAEGRLTKASAAPTDLNASAAAPVIPKDEPKPKRHPIQNFSFFITSVEVGNGGNLGGLAGADRHCQQLATAVNAGHKTWHAYLSTSIEGGPSINAGDRIGSGPWYNAKGALVARGVADLHGPNSHLDKERALNEKGEVVDAKSHDILTGTMPDGTAAVGMDCGNWTSAKEGAALLGHFDRRGDGDNRTSWNSSHNSKSCSQEDLRSTSGSGLFYCFAVETVRPRQ